MTIISQYKIVTSNYFRVDDTLNASIDVFSVTFDIVR